MLDSRNSRYLKIIVCIFTNSISNPPIKNPTASDIRITANVNRIVSCRVGQVTFFSSVATSEKNLVGPLRLSEASAIFGRLGDFGLSIFLCHSGLDPESTFLFMDPGSWAGMTITKSPLPGDKGYYTKIYPGL